MSGGTFSDVANMLFIMFNSFGAKYQTTFVVCFVCLFGFNKLSFGKEIVRKAETQTVKLRRS